MSKLHGDQQSRREVSNFDGNYDRALSIDHFGRAAARVQTQCRGTTVFAKTAYMDRKPRSDKAAARTRRLVEGRTRVAGGDLPKSPTVTNHSWVTITSKPQQADERSIRTDARRRV